MVMEKNTTLENVEFLGGVACLDFTNSIEFRRDGQIVNDFLEDGEGVVRWLRRRELLSERAARDLLKGAGIPGEEFNRFFLKARSLRETIYTIFAAVARDSTVPASALGELNDWIRKAFSHREIRHASGTFEWQWEERKRTALTPLLYPLVESAASLLTANKQSAIRECMGDDCGWLFVDTSKNGRRCWCDMKDCGNKAKAHRFYIKNRRG